MKKVILMVSAAAILIPMAYAQQTSTKTESTQTTEIPQKLITDYWKTETTIQIAQKELESTASFQHFKEAHQHLQEVIQKMEESCGKDKLLSQDNQQNFVCKDKPPVKTQKTDKK